MNQPQIEKYSPGTLLPVGSHQVKILKYLASGGFAHVYSVQISPPDPVCPDNIACLKRVVVPDKANLNTLRAEVDTMKTLRGNHCVVSYIDSHATKSPVNPGMYEVYLLMEYCSRGGLIDFMNTRLQHRLTESEVLNIMSQVCQGVAAMHALQPPLIHRDIKIENVLISKNGQFKLCDFGSVSGVIRAPRNTEEFNYVQYDVMKNTTAQYRSPEMIDLYRGLPIDEKSDIWALGVFLYKVCYYTTPFEKNGESAILTSTFQFPSYPQYSDRVRNLISVMLRVDPLKRPNICQVLEEVSRIQGVSCPIKNFYLLRVMDKHSPKNLSPVPPQLLSSPSHMAMPNQHQHQHQHQSEPQHQHQQQYQHQHQQQQQHQHQHQHQPQPSNVNAVPASNVNHMPFLHISKSQPAIAQTDYAPFVPHVSHLSMKSNNKEYPPNDPFLKIDKSALLAQTHSNVDGVPKGLKGPSLEYQPQQQFQQHSQSQRLTKTQTVTPRNSVSPVRVGGRGAIASIVASNKTSIDKPRYVDSETQTSELPSELNLSRSTSKKSIASSTLSLSSTESLEAISTGGSLTRRMSNSLKKVITGEKRGFSPIRSAQNTGESVKSAFNALRKGISTLQFTGDGNARKNSQEFRRYRNASNTSISERSENNSKPQRRSTSSFSFVPENGEHDPKRDSNNDIGSASLRRSSSLKASSSIQKRVKDLINSKDIPNSSTATGYGKYTDSMRKKELDHRKSKSVTINNHKKLDDNNNGRTNDDRKSSVVLTPLQVSTKSKPVPPPKPAHLKPNLPPKPKHLKSKSTISALSTNNNSNQERDIDSEESDIPTPDTIRDFERRFPSAL